MKDTISLSSNECVRLRTRCAHVSKYAPRTLPRLPAHCLKSKWYQIAGLKKNSFLFPALVSLSIHGLVASFFIPSFQKPCVQMGTPVEVVWEASQAKPSLVPSPLKVEEEKKIERSTHSPEHCRKIRYTPKQNQTEVRGPRQSKPHKEIPIFVQDRHSPSVPGKNNSGKEPQKQLLAKMTPPQRQAHQPLPKYPWISRKRGHEGVVSLVVSTNGEGQVIEASLHKSSGHTPLDECALETVKSWVFAEGSIQKEFSIAFRLKNLEGKLEGSA